KFQQTGIFQHNIPSLCILELMATESFRDSSDIERDDRIGSDVVVFNFAAILTAANDFFLMKISLEMVALDLFIRIMVIDGCYIHGWIGSSDLLKFWLLSATYVGSQQTNMIDHLRFRIQICVSYECFCVYEPESCGHIL
ncbi:hypothetical protein M8C21_011700, partial [Ambrosia artemisiifolia]